MYIHLFFAMLLSTQDPELWNARGVRYAQSGDMGDARKSFEQALRISPKLLSAWLNLGRTYVAATPDAASLDQGIAAYRKAAALAPHNAEAHHQLALLLQWKGDYRQSLEHLQRLPPADQMRLPTLVIRCGDEAALQHRSEARETFKQLVALPDLEAADILAILPLVSAHDAGLALDMLNGLNARGLANAETRFFEASLYERKGDLDSARKSYESGYEAAPDSAAALINLARIEWKTKDFEKALGYLAHARDLEPGNAGIHYFFGLTCNELHLPMEARKSLERALELAPGNMYYNYALGAVLLQWKEAENAIPFLVKYANARPDDSRGHLALASAYFYSEQIEKAKRELQFLVEKHESGPGLYYLRGSIRRQEGETVEAVADYRNLTALEPRWAVGHAELGALLWEQGDLDNARKETEASLAIDPKDYTANRTLMRLYKADRDPRYPDQVKALQQLAEDTDSKMRFLERTLEVHPW